MKKRVLVRPGSPSVLAPRPVWGPRAGRSDSQAGTHPLEKTHSLGV